MRQQGQPSRDGTYRCVIAMDVAAVALFVVLGFTAPGGAWWLLFAFLWAIVGVWRGVIEARRRVHERSGSMEDRDAASLEAPFQPQGSGVGELPGETRTFILAAAGSAVMLGALAVTALEPVFKAFGPLRLVVYLGLAVVAAATGLLSVAVSVTSAINPRAPVIRKAALRFCAGTGCAALAGVALLAGDSLFGRAEGMLAALSVLFGAIGLLMALHPRQTRQ